MMELKDYPKMRLGLLVFSKLGRSMKWSFALRPSVAVVST